MEASQWMIFVFVWAQYANHAYQIDVEGYSHFEGEMAINLNISINMFSQIFETQKGLQMIDTFNHVSCEAGSKTSLALCRNKFQSGIYIRYVLGSQWVGGVTKMTKEWWRKP